MNVMRETLLQKVEALEAEKSQSVRKSPWSMRYHIMPPVGWLNDPNGLCYFRGRYHVFFQYAPFQATGGLKLWGEYTSTDLIHWNYEGAVLFPDSPYDCHGVYSGSAFVEDGKMELFYTGNIKLDGDYDYVKNGRESNTIYTSTEDGIHFSDKECLMTSKDYPRGYTLHVRDPKVWKQGEHYYMVLGGRKENDQGAVILYESEDKKQWIFRGELTTPNPFGYMWECPDLFSLDGQTILSVSPQGLNRGEFKNQNVYQSGYFRVERREEQWKLSGFTEWDQGFDFYAPQTFVDGKGRRILIAWAGMPDAEEEYTNPTVAQGWQHVLTTPRELTWKDGKVYQNPVEEYKKLRKKGIPLEAGTKAVVSDKCFDLEITRIQSEECRVTIEEELELTYQAGVLKITFTGEMGSGRTSRKARLERLDQLRILADTSLMEIYANGGETVFTTRYYPKADTRRICYESAGGQCQLWELEHI